MMILLLKKFGIYAILIIAITSLYFMWRSAQQKAVRLSGNQTTLLDQVQYWKLKDSTSAASVGALSLTVHELKKANDSSLTSLRKTIDDLGVKIRLVKSASSVNYETVNNVNTFLKDSLVMDTIPVKVFDRTTKFNEVHLQIWPETDSLALRIITRDKLTQVVYKERRGWQFWTSEFWQKRKLRQVVHFENPDTRISYPQYIEISKNN